MNPRDRSRSPQRWNRPRPRALLELARHSSPCPLDARNLPVARASPLRRTRHSPTDTTTPRRPQPLPGIQSPTPAASLRLSSTGCIRNAPHSGYNSLR
jgi:hypothetical protein